MLLYPQLATGLGGLPAVPHGHPFATFYERVFPDGSAADQAADWLAELQPGNGAAALELGVGSGRVALPLADRIGEIVGVDRSPEMVHLLREAVVRTGRQVAPVQADIRGYQDGRRYSLVYCVGGTLSMLLEAEGQQQVLEACAGALAPGGAVVIETHNPAAVEARHEGRLRDSFFWPYPERDAGLLSYSVVDLDSRLWQLSHVWFEGGRAQVAAETTRLTTAEEIDAYAARSGLRLDARYGDWHGSAFSGTEPMIVCVYREDRS